MKNVADKQLANDGPEPFGLDLFVICAEIALEVCHLVTHTHTHTHPHMHRQTHTHTHIYIYRHTHKHTHTHMYK